jgi:hypothetical protein
MTPDDKFIGSLEAYLDEYEGMTPLPDSVGNAVRAQLPTTKQLSVRGGLLGGFPVMNNNIVRFGIAAAAVLLIALLGIKFLPWSAIGGPTGAPTATPKPTPSALLLGPADLNRQLGSRTYRVANSFAMPFTITLPAEWSVSTLDEGDIVFRAGYGLKFRDAYLVVDLIENVFDLPCQSDARPVNPPVRPTVDGFVEALTHIVNFTAGPVSDVRLGGHDGKAFELRSAINTDCTGDLHLWTVRGGGIGGYFYRGGATRQIRVIDVGGTIVVIDGESFPYTTDAVNDEVQEIVESIRFE